MVIIPTNICSVYIENKVQLNTYRILSLVNKIFYDTKLPGYWGLYWLEALDPCHRLILTPYYIRWKKTDIDTPFFMWLENQEIPYTATQIELVRDLENYTYEFSKLEHLLYACDGKVANLEKDKVEYLYIITMDKRILIIEGNEQIRHLSLSRGKPVLGAGTIRVQAGQVTYLDVESGHYQPTLCHMKQVIDIFNNLGAILKEGVKIKYYRNKKTTNTTLGEFLTGTYTIGLCDAIS